jgi:hypothetical protein
MARAGADQTNGLEELAHPSGAQPAAGRHGPDEVSGKPSTVVLRVPPKILKEVDAAVQARPVRIPRHTWLLEAIVEKLERENGGSGHGSK